MNAEFIESPENYPVIVIDRSKMTVQEVLRSITRIIFKEDVGQFNGDEFQVVRRGTWHVITKPREFSLLLSNWIEFKVVSPASGVAESRLLPLDYAAAYLASWSEKREEQTLRACDQVVEMLQDDPDKVLPCKSVQEKIDAQHKQSYTCFDTAVDRLIQLDRVQYVAGDSDEHFLRLLPEADALDSPADQPQPAV